MILYEFVVVTVEHYGQGKKSFNIVGLLDYMGYQIFLKACLFKLYPWYLESSSAITVSNSTPAKTTKTPSGKILLVFIQVRQNV